MDDFLGTSYDSRIWSTDITAGGTFSASDKVGGVFIMTTNPTANSYVYLYGNRGYTCQKNVEIEFMFYNSSMSDLLFEVGMRNGRQGTSGVMARMDTLASGYWIFRTNNAGSITNVTTDVALDGDIYRFIRIKTSSTEAQLFYNGQLKATINTNIPTADLEPYVYAYARSNIAISLGLNYVWAQGDRP